MSTHGRLAKFSVEDSAGTTLRDLSADLTSIDDSRSNDVHDDTTFGQTGHTKKTGLTDGSITINGFFSTTASTGTDTVLKSLLGAAGTFGFEYGPEGNATGKVKYTGECVLETYAKSIPVADLISFTATFQISGAVTNGVYP